MIVEQRTYTFAPGMLKAWLEVYEKYGFPASERHAGRQIGFFVTEVGPLNQVVFLRAFESFEAREKALAAREADPQWQEFIQHSRPLGAIVAQENKLMKPTAFSAVR